MNLQFFTWLEVQSLCLSTSVGGQNGGEATDFVLHPLIHTLLEFTLAQMFIVVKAGGVEAGTIALMDGDVKRFIRRLLRSLAN